MPFIEDETQPNLEPFSSQATCNEMIITFYFNI